MHLFAGRSMTKITHDRVSKLNMYALSNEKNTRIQFNFLRDNKLTCLFIV